MNQSTSYKSEYRSEIDGLRAFAVLSVVVFHAFPAWLKGGFVGVDIFFVISGFLITSHIFENLDKGQFSFSDFFERRIKRIFPALIFVLTSSLAFGWFVLLADEYAQLGKHVASAAVFISNFVFASEVGYFDLEAEMKPMLHLWSLAVEEQFYILWPLILWLSWKVRANLLLLTLLLFFASFITNIFWVTRAPTETFFWPFGRFWELLSGSILAWFMLYKRDFFAVVKYNEPSTSRPPYLRIAALIKKSNDRGFTSILGLSLLVSSVFFIDQSNLFPSFIALLPVSGAVLTIAGGANNWLASLLLTNRLATWIGLISYPLYLWHWPILSYLHIIEDGAPHRDKRVLAVLLSFFLAWITYRFIEKPIRFGGLKEPFRSTILVSIVLLLGVFGYVVSATDISKVKNVEGVYLRDGLEHRIGSSDRWYEGENNWLFLGNSYDQTVAKLKLKIIPSVDYVNDLRDTFLRISDAAEPSKTKIALLVGPNKSSIYREYIPISVAVPSKRYLNYFVSELSSIPNLITYDPTEDLIDLKRSEGLLYYRTDTHWNDKGAFYAFKILMSKLNLIVPEIDFSLEDSFSGDLVGISKLDDFPLVHDDNWKANSHRSYHLERKSLSSVAPSEAFGEQEVVINSNPLIDKKVWVVGDSFAAAVKPYLELTFREVRYLGHWNERLQSLATDLKRATEKPDLVVIVKVERSF